MPHDPKNTPRQDPGPYPWGWPPEGRPERRKKAEPSPKKAKPVFGEGVFRSEPLPPRFNPHAYGPRAYGPQASAAASGSYCTGAPAEVNVRAWVLGCHLSPLLFWVAGAPMLGFIGPMVLWLMKRDELSEVAEHGRESLNFQLNILLWTVVLLATCIGSILIVPLVLAGAVFSIIAACQSGAGEAYRYPYTLNLISKHTA